VLLKGFDKEKDQSYFLWKLNQNQLKHILFPVGNYTRKEVEQLAQDFKLPFFGVSKSVEVCFIPKADTGEFLRKKIKAGKGTITDASGRLLGQHEGLFYYTIGQRKGIKLAGGPYYVIGKDIKKNTLVISRNEKDLLKKEADIKNVNWILGQAPKFPLKTKVKIRYRGKPASALIVRGSASNKLIFIKPQRAITPGQSAVFYRGQEVLGGGIIN
jgi:tRNA-specific 2-thiouridylase